MLVAPDVRRVEAGTPLLEFGIRKGRLYYIHQAYTTAAPQKMRVHWGNDLLGGLYVGFLHTRYACSHESNSSGEFTIVVFPVWIVGFGLALLWGLPVSRDNRRMRTGLCPRCGYDLRATPERCPECGFMAENGREIASDLR